jgi:large subunit ribosomal protein L17
MKKLKKGRKFSREKDQRKALMISLARALFLHGKITTTEAKAKELSSFAQKIITRSKKQDIASRRFLAGPKYKDRKGGYVRIIKLAPRKSDGAKMAIIELV